MENPLARRWVWIVALGLTLWGLIGVAHDKGAPPPSSGRAGDLRMYQAITASVAEGESYYAAVATEMPARGYAIRPLFNWRLPTLAWINALPPSPRWGEAGLWAIGLGTMALWTAVVRQQIPRAAIGGAVTVAVGIVFILLLNGATYLHEVWAGLLIAASLAAWALRRTTPSIALGLAAVLIRELALPYVLVMAILALSDSRKDASAWFSVLAVFLACWSWHAWQVLGHMPADGLRNSWLVAGGWPFVLSAAHSSVFFALLPTWLVAVLLPIAWAGFWRWTSPLGRRVAIVVTVYFALFMIAGRPDNWYWGFLVAPLIPLGWVAYFFEARRGVTEFTPRAHPSP